MFILLKLEEKFDRFYNISLHSDNFHLDLKEKRKRNSLLSFVLPFLSFVFAIPLDQRINAREKLIAIAIRLVPNERSFIVETCRVARSRASAGLRDTNAGQIDKSEERGRAATWPRSDRRVFVG